MDAGTFGACDPVPLRTELGAGRGQRPERCWPDTCIRPGPSHTCLLGLSLRRPKLPKGGRGAFGLPLNPTRRRVSERGRAAKASHSPPTKPPLRCVLCISVLVAGSGRVCRVTWRAGVSTGPCPQSFSAAAADKTGPGRAALGLQLQKKGPDRHKGPVDQPHAPSLGSRIQFLMPCAPSLCGDLSVSQSNRSVNT